MEEKILTLVTPAKYYSIDWTKVITQEDIITILKALEIGFANPNEDLIKLCKPLDHD